jgi:hypothetical protein
MTETSLRPIDLLTNLIVTFLTPIFLATTGGDLNQARMAATQTVNAYTAHHPADLLLIGQSIALGLAVLSSISLSMAENIPINLILRLRGNAASLHRAADKCRSALADPQRDVYEPPLSEADLQLEQEIIAEVTRTRQRAADYQASLAHPQAPDSSATTQAAMAALQADSERRIAEADAALRSTGQPIPRHTPKTEDEYFRSAWSTAMADVADELTAGIANLPPAERRAAGIRAAALNTTANHLIASTQPRPR